MKKLLLILLICSVCYAQDRKVVVISATRANALRGKEVAKDIYFNPVQDSLGRWVISVEEIRQLKRIDTIFDYLKKLSIIRFMQPKDTIQ